MSDNNQPCPCGSGATFADCCEPVINGERESATADELMRARYSAFATGAIEFIVSSTHSRTRREVNVQDTTEWSQTSVWRGLQILETREVGDNQAYVSFAAQFTQHGKDLNHREKSLFEREDGKWRFVTGDELKNPTVRYEAPRPGRNDPCPCGSGKKYKKCCGVQG
ncbi:MAG: protein YchJ [Acidobacteria bacterium]|nr:protein YchJ [Acidobacteriota bacterium]